MAAEDQPLTKRNFWRIWINYFKILTKERLGGPTNVATPIEHPYATTLVVNLFYPMFLPKLQTEKQ
jgi:hypothetical protein